MLYGASPLFLDYVSSVCVFRLTLWEFIDMILRQVAFNLRLLPHLLWNLGAVYVPRFTWYAFTGFIIYHSTSIKWMGRDCVLRPTCWPCIDTYICLYLHFTVVYSDRRLLLGSTCRQHKVYWLKFSWCRPVPSGRFWDSPSIRPLLFPSVSFQIRHSSIILPLTLYT